MQFVLRHEVHSIQFNQYQGNQYVLLLLKYRICYHLSLLGKLKVQEALGVFQSIYNDKSLNKKVFLQLLQDLETKFCQRA